MILNLSIQDIYNVYTDDDKPILAFYDMTEYYIRYVLFMTVTSLVQYICLSYLSCALYVCNLPRLRTYVC